MRCTGSLGWAPAPHQDCTRSGVTSVNRGAFLGWEGAKGFDRLGVALGTRVGYDDAVLRVADLAHPQKPDLDGHVFRSCRCSRSTLPAPIVGLMRLGGPWVASLPVRGLGHAPDASRLFCQI